ncbi:MAG: zinc dependent phospholipase C family protein [Clostridium sp.]|uniref:zinc dependent phospholipase C family protein n=1 Tax=Clostridium sp. TaxID=1506 RepID=UPI0039EC8D96
MIINTHILFSKIVYKHCLKELNFKLNKNIFMYGNIKPDISPDTFKSSHTLKDSIGIVSEHFNELSNNKLDIKQFSMLLGMICHYTADYFCIYHTEEYSKKSIFKHIAYEIALHINLRILLIRGKLKIIDSRSVPQRNVLSIIYNMQEKYFQKKRGFLTDIIYAVSTITMVIESIIYFNVNKFENIETYELSKNIGGII